MPNFIHKVVAIVNSIPKGKVMSYGQVAANLGSPRAARRVGWALHLHDGDDSFPWWRVINNQGRISIKGNWSSTPAVQKALLEKEGVAVTEDFIIDIEAYRYKPSLAAIERVLKNVQE